MKIAVVGTGIVAGGFGCTVDRGYNLVGVDRNFVELALEEGHLAVAVGHVRQRLDDRALNFNGLFFCHMLSIQSLICRRQELLRSFFPACSEPAALPLSPPPNVQNGLKAAGPQ